MLKYTLKKILALIPKLLLISFVIYFALDLLPGDALSKSIPMDMYVTLSDAQKDAMREAMGLTGPLYERYFSWLFRVLQGDFGYSQSTGSNIATMIATRLPYTIELAVLALLLSYAMGITVGYLTAVNKNTLIDYIGSGTSVISISMPNFVFGILLMLFFTINLTWFPTGGRMSVGDDSLIGRLPYMFLPALALSITYNGGMTRFTRGTMLDVLNKDYIKTARSKGLSETVVNVEHGFRNALPPITTVMCMDLPKLVGGSVVVESVFNYPAMGSMVVDAVNANDIPVVMISTMITAMVTLLGSTLVDVVNAALDPRVRFE